MEALSINRTDNWLNRQVSLNTQAFRLTLCLFKFGEGGSANQGFKSKRQPSQIC